MTIFEKRMVSMYGAKGEKWLKALPGYVNQLAQEWNVTDLQPFSNLSYNYVAAGVRDTLPVVLKITLGVKEFEREIAALKVFEGYGFMPLIISKEDAMVVERARPGSTLKTYFPAQENASLHIFSNLIDIMHKASMDSTRIEPYRKHFTPLESVVNILEKELDIPAKYLSKARMLKDHLLATTQEEVVLHGDLHHENILQHGGGFMAIDPKGYFGDRWYDVGPFIRNPIDLLMETPAPLSLLVARIEMLSLIMKGEFERLAQWGFVQSVLTWAWALEDGTEVGYLKKEVPLFYELVK